MATFRLRKPGGGSSLRGGDGVRAPDRNVYEYAATGGIILSGTADVSAIKVFRADGGLVLGGSADVAITRSFPASGGIVLGGEASTEFVDGRGYVASGGLVFGGAADTQFVSASKPATDHGGGGYFPSRTIGIPIRRRQYGHGVTHEYRGDGGVTFGGAAVVEFVPGRNKQKQENENAAFLLMAA